jgi:trk system potassium uptake protein
MGTYNVTLRKPGRARGPGSGSLQIIGGVGFILLLGTVLLSLPIAAADGEATRPFDALFTAVSALCVTGLVVVDTQEHWSFFGEVVILFLFQIGGLGYMLGTSLVLWLLGRQLGLRDRYMLRLYYGAPSMGETLAFARNVALFALTIEAIGIAALYIAFVAQGVDPDTAVWWSIFHAVSAFNNAGFNVTGADLVPFVNDAPVLLVVSALVILGGIGAIPVLALLRRRSIRRLPLDSKIIYLTTGILLAVGTVFMMVVEWDNQATLGTADTWHRPILAFFQTAVPRTAGFSAIEVVDFHDESKFFQMALMLIGGAAGSTAGGIKVGTFALLGFAMFATLRGTTEVRALGRSVPIAIVFQAITIALLGIAVAFIISVALLYTETMPDIDILFDALSAVGTVGLSTGVPQAATDAGRGIFIVAMILGRFGPLLLVLEMTRRRHKSTFRAPEDSIRLG